MSEMEKNYQSSNAQENTSALLIKNSHNPVICRHSSGTLKSIHSFNGCLNEYLNFYLLTLPMHSFNVRLALLHNCNRDADQTLYPKYGFNQLI